MPVVPLASDLDSFGGRKENFEPVSIRSQQIDAKEWNEMAASVSAMSKTAFHGEFSFQYVDGYVELTDHIAVWGSSSFLSPAVVRNSQGVFTVTLPESIIDELGREYVVSLRSGIANCAADARQANVSVSDSNVLVIRVRTLDGATDDGSEEPITVYFRVR